MIVGHILCIWRKLENSSEIVILDQSATENKRIELFID